MPLSAAFHFFSPFHSKKKYHYTITLSSISFFFLVYPFLFHLTIPSVLSFGPIFVILVSYLKNNKKIRDFIAIVIIHKYFIHNNLII